MESRVIQAQKLFAMGEGDEFRPVFGPQVENAQPNLEHVARNVSFG